MFLSKNTSTHFFSSFRLSSSLPLLCFFGFVLCASPGFALDLDTPRLQELAGHPYWHKLLHYRHKGKNKVRSKVDGMQFFLAPNGKTNSQAELAATLKALFAPDHANDDANQAPACRFPLRYQWLRDQLNLPVAPLAELNCPRLHTWLASLGVQGLSLVFASSHINNPASMFGHTFLRFHRFRDGQELNPLLHYTANFAAETGDEGGLLYTVKGLFGGYPGKFSTFPYYHKIRQYNQHEGRDLWEYPLDLSPAAIDQILLHLWELGHTHFDYYFLSENCSYFLLALLEAADEQTQILHALPFFTIPGDTLKAVRKHTPWLGPTSFRPSKRRIFLARLGQLSRQERQIFAKAQHRNDFSSLANHAPERQAAVLDALIEHSAYLSGKTPNNEWHLALLEKRSQVEHPAAPIHIVTAPHADPLTAHPTSRLGLGAAHQLKQNFVSLNFRGAYHDLLNEQAGFSNTASIEMLNASLLVHTDQSKLRLEQVDVVHIQSLSPLTPYLNRPSWNLNFGWTQVYADDCAACGSLFVKGGPGVSMGLHHNNRLLAFAFANAFAHIAPWNNTQYRLGPQFETGILFDLGQALRVKSSGLWEYSPLGAGRYVWAGRAEAALQLAPRFELRAFLTRWAIGWMSGGALYYYF